MKNKILITLLMLAAFCIVNAEEQTVALEELKYTLFLSEKLIGSEPSKYYTLTISSKSTSGSGVIFVKRMDGQFNETLVFIDKEGVIRTSDGKNEVIIGALFLKWATKLPLHDRSLLVV